MKHRWYLTQSDLDAGEVTLPPALAVGEHVALDFLNSAIAPKGVLTEWLPDGEHLLSWLDQMGLISRDEALRHFAAADFDPVAATARTLRPEIRQAVQQRVEGGSAAVDTAHFAGLNAILAQDNRHTELLRQEGGFATPRRLRWQSPTEVLLPLADAIADLFCRADFSLIQKCENPKCTVWFLDRTKSHRRRWCSTAICGNRAKAAAHRARQKNSPAHAEG